MEKKFAFIDLFAGIGGLRIPFQDIGECVFTSEKDAAARTVYAANFDENIDEIDQDVSKFGIEVPPTFPDHDLLLAGFPCQPFSHAGKKLGFEDARGTLFFSIANIISSKSPKVVLLENVRGLKSHDGGRTFSVIQGTLRELGYVVHFKVLNARDYGLPQNRNRLFIVAIRADLQNAENYEFPEPTHDRSDLFLGSILKDNPAPELTISDRLWAGHQLRKAKNQEKGTGFGYQIFTPTSTYAATLSARYYKDGSEILIAQKNNNPRKLSVLEAMNLQGFPETFEPHKSSKEAYKQFGNAVPVNVVRAISKTLVPYLTN